MRLKIRCEWCYAYSMHNVTNPQNFPCHCEDCGTEIPAEDLKEEYDQAVATLTNSMF